jgi:hypothetical protein
MMIDDDDEDDDDDDVWRYDDDDDVDDVMVRCDDHDDAMTTTTTTKTTTTTTRAKMTMTTMTMMMHDVHHGMAWTMTWHGMVMAWMAWMAWMVMACLAWHGNVAWHGKDGMHGIGMMACVHACIAWRHCTWCLSCLAHAHMAWLHGMELHEWYGQVIFKIVTATQKRGGLCSNHLPRIGRPKSGPCVAQEDFFWFWVNRIKCAS